MNHRSRRADWLVAMALTFCLALASAALAQETPQNYDERGLPTNVPVLEASRPLAAWGLGVVFLVGFLAIAFKPSKRVHGA